MTDVEEHDDNSASRYAPSRAPSPKPTLLMRICDWLRGSRSPRGFLGFDFGSYDFPTVDIEREVQRLRLVELAMENGRAEIPATRDSALDGPQLRVYQFIFGEVSRVQAQYESALSGLNGRIRDLGAKAKVQHLEELAHEYRHDLQVARGRADERLKPALERLAAAREKYRRFREDAGLTRPASYPESRFIIWSFIVGLTVAEAIVNSYFFTQGSEFGIAGGILTAFLLATIDLAIVFTSARWATFLSSVRPHHKAGGLLAALLIAAWIPIYNILVGHVREALETSPSFYAQAGLESFISSPFGLTQADSWMLVVVGVVLSALGVVAGLEYDDRYPGYGDVDRNLREAEAEIAHLDAQMREQALTLRDRYLKDVGLVAAEIRRDIVALESTIKTKDLLLKNVQTFKQYYQETCNTLVRTYRDHNVRFRSTNAPSYFSDRWQMELPESLTVTIEEDERNLKETKRAERQLGEIAKTARTAVRAIYSEFMGNGEEEGQQ